MQAVSYDKRLILKGFMPPAKGMLDVLE